MAKAPKTFHDWMLANFDKNELADIARHGADTGYGGLTYTSDTVELFDTYGEEIWDMAYEMSQDVGAKNVLEFIGSFRRTDMADNLDGFKNLMVWFAAEEIARQEAGDE